MKIEFESERIAFSKLAGTNGEIPDELPETQKNLLMTAGIPRVNREKNSLIINKDYTYQITVEKIEPKQKIAQEIFQGSKMDEPLPEPTKTIITNTGSTVYDQNGAIMRQSTIGNSAFDIIINKLKNDSEFRKNVNVSNLFFRIGANANNFLNEKVKDFFINENANIIKEDGYLYIIQKYSDIIKKYFNPLKPTYNNLNTASSSNKDAEITDQESYIKNEQDKAKKLIEESNFADNIDIVTVVSEEENIIKGEVCKTKEGAIVSMANYKTSNDENKTIEASYLESYMANIAMPDLNIVSVTSTTYENVSITNNLKE